MMDVSILALSTAVPPYAFSQDECTDKFIKLLGIDEELAKTIKKLSQNSEIQTRYAVIPDFKLGTHELDFFAPDFPKKIPGTAQRNEIYRREAPKLAYAAAAKAMESWGGDPGEITHIISVSCTGMVAPGIEFDLMQLLKLPPTTERFGINFMGCFGAFKGLTAAQAMAKENPKNRILLVCTELCSLHFQAEQTPDNVLGNLLFSDGAAAVILGAEPKPQETPLWEIRNKRSFGLSNTSEKMTWVLGDQGFLMKLSPTVPVLIGRNIRPFVESLAGADFSAEEYDWAIHPGGKSVIQAIEKAFKLDRALTQASWDTLAHYGNMSSTSFLFVMHRLLELKSSKKWTLGVGFGPGLSVEGILFRKKTSDGVLDYQTF